MTNYILSELRSYPGLYNSFDLMEINGPYPGTETNICNGNFMYCTMDSSYPLQSAYCVIPTLQEEPNYSYTKNIVLCLHTDSINNEKIVTIKCYPTQLSQIPGFNILVNDYPTILLDGKTSSGVPRKNYEQSTGIIGLTGNPMKYSRKFSHFTRENPMNLGFDPIRISSNILQLQVELFSNVQPGNIRDIVKLEWLIETE